MNVLNDNIALYGFMGSGKSTIGKRLSEKLSVPFIDLDTYIETQTGMSIVEIFSTYGENFFRQKEEEILLSLSQEEPHVLSLGGGSLLKEDSKTYVSQNYKLFTLIVPFSIIQKRISASDRPLAKSAKFLFDARESHYREVGIVINLEEQSPQASMELIWEHLNAA